MNDHVPQLARLSAGQIDALRARTAGLRIAVSARPHDAWIELSDGRRETVLECSFAQSRLWFLEQWGPGSPLYHIVQTLRVCGPLDASALQTALDDLVERHETLRTGFTERDGEPLQRILSSARCVLEFEDLRALVPAMRETQLNERLHTHAARAFDLHEPPLLRAALWRLDDDRHVLQLVIHHIASDGWSQGVLNRELSALYAAALQGDDTRLPDLPVHYADYALWQRKVLADAALQMQLEYWRTQLADLPLLRLPTDRTRPAQPSYSGSAVRFEIEARLAGRLRALAREAGGTLYMVLLAAFNVLLARASGQDDIVVGTPVAGRGQMELEGLIGFFVNTLVLRTKVPMHAGFRDVLGNVKETALGAFDHAQIPFEKLVEALRPERDPSRNPLFQILFVLQNTPQAELVLQGTHSLLLPRQSGIAKFDLSLELTETADTLSGLFEYAVDLFDGPTVERMAVDYRALLEDIVADPDVAVGMRPTLTPETRQKVLVGWNATAIRYPQDATLVSLFEARVACAPDTVALVFGDRTLTYAELNLQANRIAHALRALGVGPDVMVGLHLERSVELVTGLLGVLKAGGAYVPLDPAYPEARLTFMLEDTAAPVVLTQAALQSRLPAHAGQTICLDGDDAHRLDGMAGNNPASVLNPDHLAYVIYTSGSTGRPKGVMISHAAICNHMHWMIDTFGFCASDRVFQKTGICADASVWEFFAPLLSGGCLVLAVEGSQRDPAHLQQQIRALGVTVMQAVPSLLRLLVAEPGFADCRSLRHVFCGGETLDAPLAAAFFAVSDARLHNLYGPTEAAIDATWWTCDRDDRRPPPIGRPIANLQAYVLDGLQQPVPVGATGELYIGGAGLARGYLGRPELTAERFVAHPFSVAPGARLYRTGDLVRWRADGSLEFICRVDHQIKLRGFRIEPGEIEAALLDQPGIGEAVAVVREDRPGDQRLVAYVVPRDGAPDVAALRGQLGRVLPAHMVPSTIVMMDALPLTPNGKIDRAALPAPGPDATQQDLVAPRTATEETLAAIWAETLGLPTVGIRQNFFELGGHSLLAVRLVNRLRCRFACDLPLRSVFDMPTVERMAQAFPALLANDGRAPPLDGQTPEERQKILVDWNDTAADYPSDSTLATLFEAQVARAPGAVALTCGDRTLTYAELNVQANRIAHALRALGVGPDVMVGLHLERSVEQVAGVLGILKAGGAYVPLDQAYPAARIAFMLADTAASVVLTRTALQTALPAHACRTLCVDDTTALAQQPRNNPEPVATSTSPAYVIYTSGSTGQPKGVLVEQHSVARLVFGVGYASFGPDETFLLLAPMTFDASTFELWGALLHGARCVIHPEATPTAAGLETVIARHGISTLWLTAALFNAVIDERPSALRGLRQLLTGGEALSVAHVRRALAALPGVRLINGYGPTEGTTFTCCYTIPPDLPDACTSIPIGRPIGNTEVFVLDAGRQPVPIGAEGELYIGGYRSVQRVSCTSAEPDLRAAIWAARN